MNKSSNKHSGKERLQYWFDNKMTEGSISLFKLLIISTIAAIALVTLVGMLLGFGAEDGFKPVLWDSFATIINAWMPYYEDGEGNIAYLLVMTAAAICGVAFTGVLIGIITSGIEEKLTGLRHGNAPVLEEGHTVILGFTPGEYTLIEQLILAANGKPRCIVVAADLPREEMEEAIRDNIDLKEHSNIRLICRSIDIFDPVALERVAVSACDNVIISPTDDKNTAKALLAVSAIINSADNDHVRVGAIVSRDEYRFPESAARKHNVTTLQTNEVIAKIIAHSCTQPGLSDTFREVFNFEGSELYVVELPEAVGLTFEEILTRLDDAAPLGILRDGEVVLNPDEDMKLLANDRLVIFAATGEDYRLMPAGDDLPGQVVREKAHETRSAGRVLIIGYNSGFRTVFRELPENVTEVTVDCSSDFHAAVEKIAKKRPEIRLTLVDNDLQEEDDLQEMALDADHVVLLGDHELEADDADMQIIFRIMHLRDLRDKQGLNFNITAEMNLESNQRLIEEEDRIDFVVSSNTSSLLLAQLAESPALLGAFRELLSNQGNEFYLKEAAELDCLGTHTIRELRQAVYERGYILIGYISGEDYRSVFNPALNTTIQLKAGDRLIVIGEE